MNVHVLNEVSKLVDEFELANDEERVRFTLRNAALTFGGLMPSHRLDGMPPAQAFTYVLLLAVRELARTS